VLVESVDEVSPSRNVRGRVAAASTGIIRHVVVDDAAKR